MSWLIFRCISGRENISRLELSKRGVECVFPARIEEKRRHRKGFSKIRKHVPTIPGYLFVPVVDDVFTAVRAVPSVRKPLGVAGVPVVVDQAVVDQAMLTATQEPEDDEDPILRYMRKGCAFQNGDTVRVLEGPLTGFTGECLNIEGKQTRIQIVQAGHVFPVVAPTFDLACVGGG